MTGDSFGLGGGARLWPALFLLLFLLVASLLGGCLNADTPPFRVGSATGDLTILQESCSCSYDPDTLEAQLTCSKSGESSRYLFAWIPTGPRYHETTVGQLQLWVDEPDQRCDYYGAGIVESWIGPPEPDPDGDELVSYVPLHMRRWSVPAQSMCQGDGIRCFDYSECIEWPESAAEDMTIWCHMWNL